MKVVRHYYYGRILRSGRHYTTVLGQKLVFSVSTPSEITRIDGDFTTEAELVKRIVDALRPGEVFFDVGANIGLVSLAVAAVHRDDGVTVEAFEPEPRNANQFRENLNLNGMRHITVHEMALGRSPGTVTLYVSGETGAGTHTINPDPSREHQRVDVRMSSIDAIAEQSARSPNVLKIDVEGAEVEVLFGASNVLESGCVHDLFIELHRGRMMTEGFDVPEVEAWLHTKGYKVVWSVDRGAERHCHLKRRVGG